MAGFFSYFISVINGFGYFGIFIATALEYACFPISSELLLPFIGYSVYMGQRSLPLAVLFSTMGAAVGCSFCYGAGRFGRGLIENTLCAKIPALREGIEKADRFFNEIGRQSVLVGRFMPLVRTYVSFPAGMSRMKFSIFFIYSTMGALFWNLVLISLGYVLGNHWQSVTAFFSNNKTYLALGALVLILLFLYKKLSKRIFQS